MYPKNTASPRVIYAKVVSATDGSPLTTSVAAYHVEGANRTTGDNSAAHIANGIWSYTPSQAETNYDAFAIEFYHASAVGTGPVVEVVTSAADWDTAIAESYSTNGVAATPAQLLYQITSMLGNHLISDETLTTYKINTATTAMTFEIELDVDGDPIGLTRLT